MSMSCTRFSIQSNQNFSRYLRISASQDYDIGSKKKKSSKAVPQKDNYKQPNVSIVEYEDITSIPSNGPPYACNVCSLSFPIVKSLVGKIFHFLLVALSCRSLQIAHRSIHRGKKFQCDVCKHVFKSKSHVYEHMKVRISVYSHFLFDFFFMKVTSQ